MSTFDNAPPPADWAPDCRCGTCTTCVPAPTIGPHIHLGEN